MVHRVSGDDSGVQVLEADRRLEAECKTVLRTEASAAFTGQAPITIRPDVAKFTWEKTGSEQGGVHESEPFVSLLNSRTSMLIPV